MLLWKRNVHTLIQLRIHNQDGEDFQRRARLAVECGLVVYRPLAALPPYKRASSRRNRVPRFPEVVRSPSSSHFPKLAEYRLSRFSHLSQLARVSSYVLYFKKKRFSQRDNSSPRSTLMVRRGRTPSGILFLGADLSSLDNDQLVSRDRFPSFLELEMDLFTDW